MATKTFCDICGKEIAAKSSYRIVTSLKCDEPYARSTPPPGQHVVEDACEQCATRATAPLPRRAESRTLADQS